MSKGEGFLPVSDGGFVGGRRATDEEIAAFRQGLDEFHEAISPASERNPERNIVQKIGNKAVDALIDIQCLGISVEKEIAKIIFH